MDDNEKIEFCARAAHEMNRIYCEAMGDSSQQPWQDALDWQKQSARLGVEGALAGNTPKQSHKSWLAVKEEDGWKYGQIKDPERKQHPCFVPYEQLPPAQQMKDDLFLGTVRSMAAALGMTVTYPEMPSIPARDGLPAMPAFPRRTINYAEAVQRIE